jgi:tyrosine-protein kinase Etk/Wzc
METQNSMREIDNTKSVREYLILIKNNIFPIILISITCLVVSIIYALNARNIYNAATVLKISKPQGNILESSLLPSASDFGADRFIANEIEILKSYTVRERVAKSLVDSFRVSVRSDSFYMIMSNDFSFSQSETKLKSIPEIAASLARSVAVEQKRGLDIVEVKAESASPSEAAMIANCYASAYNDLNLDINRRQLTVVKNFLAQQRDEKLRQLNEAEDILEKFQKTGGIISIDEQTNTLIQQQSTLESQKNSVKIDLLTSEKMLGGYKNELKKQDPRLANYVENFATETYIKSLQEQLAKAEVTKDLAVANNKEAVNSPNVKELDSKIKELKEKINQKFDIFKQGAFASSPAEMKLLAQKIMDEEIKSQSLRATVSELDGSVRKYENIFNKLPKTIIEYARLKRQRESYEKLYLAIEEKYNEAQVNEQSQPGNVILIDAARKPIAPAKPNRLMIVAVGFILGLGISFGYVFVRNYFDNTVKTPDDFQTVKTPLLAWIPQIEGLAEKKNRDFEFIVAKKPDSIPSEAFRTLRTRLQFSKLENTSSMKILITSSAPQEGKTVICANLAGSFAQTGKKTLLIDCDLRKPRIHSIFGVNRYPGLIDYFFQQASLNEIIRNSDLSNLDYIPAGTIPPNPAETLDSQTMKDFIRLMSEKYEIIILDSPPIIAVTDSEILANLVDATILVVSAGTTEKDMMEKSVELLSGEKGSLIGAVLNNFAYKNGYGSYYKYYYYYSNPSKNDAGRLVTGKNKKQTAA